MRSGIDPHTHSRRSHGAFYPDELTATAVTARPRIIAPTDHDTLQGVQEAADAPPD
ncbi:hypothetical protein FAIPA1_600007 [Frankia sp. AiPs1]